MNLALRILVGVLATITLALAVLFIIPATRNFMVNGLSSQSLEYQTVVGENDNLNDALTNANTELSELRSQLNSKNTELTSKTGEIQELNEELENIRQNLNSKINEVSTLMGIINNKNNTISDKNDTIQIQNNTINQLNNELMSLNQTILDLQQQVNDMESYIYLLEHQDYEEITDFEFTGNAICSYLGTDSVVNVPTSYSVLKDNNGNEIVRSITKQLFNSMDLSYAYNERNIYYPNALITDSNGLNVYLDDIYNNYDATRTYENILEFPATMTFDKKIYIVGDEIPVTMIGKSCFSGNQNITQVNIPDTITVIGKGAFWGLLNLTQIYLPDSVVEIGEEAFMHCENLQNVTLSNNLELIDYGAFCHCYALRNLDIPASVNSIGMYVFQSCDNLEVMNIYSEHIDVKYSSSYFPDKTYDSHCGWFLSCPTTATLHIPSSITNPADAYGDTWNMYGTSTTQRLNYYADLMTGDNPSQDTPCTVTFMVGNQVYYSYQSAENVNVVLPPPPPALNGVPFTGWNPTKDAPFAVDVQYLLVTGDWTFYAVFGGMW